MKQNKNLRLKELEAGIKAAKAALSKIAYEGLYQWESVTVETDRQSEEKDEFLRKLSETLTAALAQNKKTSPESATPATTTTREAPKATIKLIEEQKVSAKENKPESNIEEQVNWQATVKVMRSVATIALSMIEDMAEAYR